MPKEEKKPKEEKEGAKESEEKNDVQKEEVSGFGGLPERNLKKNLGCGG